jgi:hypothetical protein
LFRGSIYFLSISRQIPLSLGIVGGILGFDPPAGIAASLSPYKLGRLVSHRSEPDNSIIYL